MNQVDKFFMYLNQFEWNSPEYAETIIQCVTEDNNLKAHNYKTLKEAFEAGEELAIHIHEPCITEIGGYGICIDKIERPITSYADDTNRRNECLIEAFESAMVFTIQNSLQFKRFGVTSGYDGLPSMFFDSRLHPDITKAMSELLDRFR